MTLIGMNAVVGFCGTNDDVLSCVYKTVAYFNTVQIVFIIVK